MMRRPERPFAVLYGSNGYVFEEIFRPLIENLRRDHAVIFLQATYYLNRRTTGALEELRRSGALEEIEIFDPYRSRGEDPLGYHRRLRRLADRVCTDSTRLLVVDSECTVWTKTLISRARCFPRVRVVTLQCGTLWRLLAAYRKAEGIDEPPPYGDWRRKPGRPRPPLRRRVRNRILREVRSRSAVWLDHGLWPLLLSGAPLPVTPFDRFMFTVGLADTVLCFDPMEERAVRTLVPHVWDLHVVAHPAQGACRCGGRKRDRRLLVVFGGMLAEEPDEDRLARWTDVIRQTMRHGRLGAVDIRLHPRTRPEMLWPRRMAEALGRDGLRVRLMPLEAPSLVETACDYTGVLGGPSGGLRVAAAVCPHLFVLGLPNSSDGTPDDQDWILGEASGVRWIRDGRVRTEDLRPVGLAAQGGRPRPEDFLRGDRCVV